MLKGEPFTFISYLMLISVSVISLVANLPLFFQVPLHTVLLIYLGSMHSLKQYKPKDSKDEKVEVMTQKDAWVFPIFGSAVLFGLYILFQIFDKEHINVLFHIYFTAIGVYTIACYLYERLINNPLFSGLKNVVLFEIPPIKWISEVKSAIDLLFLITFFVGLGIGAAYYMTQHWALNNMLGICFSIFGIENMLLGQYKVGLILLVLLFFYDIFWVFGTPVMVTVAKNLNGPIKLMFPKDLFAEELKYNMIGLGDIVIPGVFVALMLRFDFVNYLRIHKDDSKKEKDMPWSFFNVIFFNITLVGYTLGIFATLFVMIYFEAAQPALLYLVPGILISSFLTALCKGNLKDLWRFDEEIVMKELAGTPEKKN